MRIVIPSLFAIALLGLLPVRGQIYTVAATGTTTGAGSGTYLAGVPSGTDFTFTFSFNAAQVTTLLSSPVYGGEYATPSGTATLSLNGLTFTDDVGTGLVINSATPGGPFGPEYGFSLGLTSVIGGSAQSSPTPNINIMEIDLDSSVSTVAPSISLSSLQTSPISDFYFHELTLEIAGGTANGSILDGSVTDFSVTTTAAPEPSAITLFLLAASLFFGIRACQRGARRAD